MKRLRLRLAFSICFHNFAHAYVFKLKRSYNGGKEATAKQIADRNYTAPFEADKRKVIALATECDYKGPAGGGVNIKKQSHEETFRL